MGEAGVDGNVGARMKRMITNEQTEICTCFQDEMGSWLRAAAHMTRVVFRLEAMVSMSEYQRRHILETTVACLIASR
jgi:hypothetical protein